MVPTVTLRSHVEVTPEGGHHEWRPGDCARSQGSERREACVVGMDHIERPLRVITYNRIDECVDAIVELNIRHASVYQHGVSKRQRQIMIMGAPGR